jgi:formylglycine-generating enzyme required for sulfatase activity
LPYSKKLPQSQSPSETAPIVNDLLEIPAGRATLGLSRGASAPFGWDNEFESSIVTVPRFKISKFMISNAEFLRFVEDGGYQNSKYWSPEDWRWKQLSAVRHPVFWKQEGSTWSYRGMFEELPFRSNWPVYVSHAESSAYARWANGCLPTEAQWHRAAYGTPEGTERAYPWGSSSPTPELGNLDFERWDPESVDRNPANKSAWGVVGQLGNGWEWTATPFAPFPGFEPAAYYPGYSANFFDGQHYVIKGGSARTASCLLRRSFRNWFQPHYQYVYTGFRCVTD